jgi:Xaa-Pro aminopeptidase
MKMDYQRRIKELQGYLINEHIDAAFIMISSDLQYLTGVQRPPHNPTDDNKHGDELYGAFITQDGWPLFVVPRMGASKYVGSQIRGMPWADNLVVIMDGDDPAEIATSLMDRLGHPKKMGVCQRLWAKSMFRLQKASPGLEWADISSFVAKMRAVKDASEIEIMMKAGELTDQVFGSVVHQMRVGMTEYDLIREVAHQVTIHGGNGLSFHTGVIIRGEGKPRRFMADGMTANTPLLPETVVSFDFGLIYQGYVSDFGRTVFCGDPPAEWVLCHELVMAAQKAGIEAMQGGRITAAELNRISRDIIEKEGYGQYFTHRLGHGIGIDVHESPFLFERDHTVLQKGMCFTIEPSIVIPDRMGVRVEDVVMVGDSCGIPFSNYTKNLIVI